MGPDSGHRESGGARLTERTRSATALGSVWRVTFAQRAALGAAKMQAEKTKHE